MKDADSTEFNQLTKHPVIYFIKEWYDYRTGKVQIRDEATDLGGTLRLGAYPCKMKPGTFAHTAYGTDEIQERHRHRYEFNNLFKDELVQHGLIISGTSPDEKLVEIVECQMSGFWSSIRRQNTSLFRLHQQLGECRLAISPVFPLNKMGRQSKTAFTRRTQGNSLMGSCGGLWFGEKNKKRYGNQIRRAKVESVRIPDFFEVGPNRPFLLIGGPCVIESAELCREVAAGLQEICGRLGISYMFKASFDKANRTSLAAFRGPGLDEGLRILADIRRDFGVPVVSDVHEVAQVGPAAEVLDVLQIPAFLCRQTDLLVAAAKSGKVVSLKKGQFVSPWDMQHAVSKINAVAKNRLMLMERGTTFGYNNLVVDMRSLPVMRSFGCPVIYDATHSVQLPGGAGGSSGGQREFIPTLARAAVAAGIDGLFMEIHPDPAKALCDGPNSMPSTAFPLSPT
jgi:2-dehydro-3-deoxyphosphooctonate aldolase (KDO 8-P synthase)